jgi:hypothetical protein
VSQFVTTLENGADTGPRVRATSAVGMHPNNSKVRARAGLRPDGGGAVTVSPGTMTVNVAALSCWVDSPTAGQYGFPFVSDASVALTIDPGDATQVRVDVIAVVVRENAFDGGGATTAQIEVIKGTPGAGAPALPAAALPLRNISVHAGASTGTGGLSNSNLSTDRRTWTVAAGGVLPVASQTERDALSSSNTLRLVYRIDTGHIEVYNKATSQWDTLYVVEDTGWVSRPGQASPLYRAKQGWVQVAVSGSVAGNVPNDTTKTLLASGNAIPSAYRPSDPKRAMAYFGGAVGYMTVMPDGTITCYQNSGSDKPTVSGIVTYPIE